MRRVYSPLDKLCSALYGRVMGEVIDIRARARARTHRDPEPWDATVPEALSHVRDVLAEALGHIRSERARAGLAEADAWVEGIESALGRP